MTRHLNPQIEQIINDTPYLPLAFKSILTTDAYFAANEEMIDCLCFEREGYDIKSNFIVKHEDWQPTILIIATHKGVTILVEGGSKISDVLFGYRMTHISYAHIISIELDVRMLNGRLVISTGEGMEKHAIIQFNTAKYYRECERFMETLRKKIFGEVNAQ